MGQLCEPGNLFGENSSHSAQGLLMNLAATANVLYDEDRHLAVIPFLSLHKHGAKVQNLLLQ